MSITFSSPDIDLETQERTERFFRIVATASDEEILALVNEGIDIKARDINGFTALIYAALSGKTKTVRALLDAGSELDARDNRGNTALMEAAWNGHTETVLALLDAGAEIDARDNRGNTALMIAAWNGQTKTVLALLDAGAELDARDNRGNTALMIAASNGHTETVLALHKAGAELDARDNFNDTALMRAAWNGKTETVLALLERGANVNAKNDHGNAAEDYSGIEDSPEAKAKISQWRKEYKKFILNGNPPKTADYLYHLLAVYPLTDPTAKVDTIKHIRKICDHAKWKSEEQLSGILNILKENGTFGPEPTVATTTIQAILDANFPPQHQVNSLSNQPSAARMGK